MKGNKFKYLNSLLNVFVPVNVSSCEMNRNCLGDEPSLQGSGFLDCYLGGGLLPRP